MEAFFWIAIFLYISAVFYIVLKMILGRNENYIIIEALLMFDVITPLFVYLLTN